MVLLIKWGKHETRKKTIEHKKHNVHHEHHTSGSGNAIEAWEHLSEGDQEPNQRRATKRPKRSNRGEQLKRRS